MGRAILLRASVLQAREDCCQLREWAACGIYEGDLRATEALRKPSEAAPAQEGNGAMRGHGNARWHLWQREAKPASILFTDDHL